MLLHELLDGIYVQPIDDVYRHWDVHSICCDSRKVKRHDMFIALRGIKDDGSRFIQDAVDKGARVIATSQSDVSYTSEHDVLILQVEDPQKFLRDIAVKFYGNPAELVKVIGITGTNGKTTIAYLLESIFQAADFDSGVIGTVNYRFGSQKLPSQNTTPGLLDNQRMLSEMAKEGLDYALMEVSSHALVQGRVDLIDFHTSVFTNLTSDHLDYHETREKYFQAKAKLFVELTPHHLAVINNDDRYGRKLISMTDAKVMTYGLRDNADVTAKDVQAHISGTQFKLVSPDGYANIRTNLVGEFNIYNILAAAAVAIGEGVSLDHIKKGIEAVKAVPGRLEKLEGGQDFTVLIDYAHTQDALENVLNALRQTSDGRIIVVFGCGGDRDKSKRFEMGRVVSQLADYAVITNDNPRSEEPLDIIEQIKQGFDHERFEIIPNRDEAIKKSLEVAGRGDIVLIAGKGHETYQIFKDRTIHFDERQVVRQYLQC